MNNNIIIIVLIIVLICIVINTVKETFLQEYQVKPIQYKFESLSSPAYTKEICIGDKCLNEEQVKNIMREIKMSKRKNNLN